MSRKRPGLAYVVGTLNPGGTERLVVEMARAFARSFDVTVFCLDEPGAWATDVRREGIPVECLWRQAGLDLSVAHRLAGRFRDRAVDIVHAHQCTPWFYSALARLLCRRPRLLLEEHGRFHPEVDKPLRRRVNRLLIRRLTHRFVAVSADIRERLVRYEGLDRDEVEVVYNGVGTSHVIDIAERSALRESLGIGEDEFVVGSVGRLDSIKNLPMLVGALDVAASSIPRAAGLIVGDGPMFDELDAMMRERRLEDRIRMTGYREDASRCVQCMDVFVLSSFSEGTSMALLEAMAAGIPAIVTAVGGNPEIVDDDCGWLVPSGDVEAMAAAIGEAAGDRAALRAKGAAASERVAARFGFDRMVDTYRSIYATLGAGRADEPPGSRAGS